MGLGKKISQDNARRCPQCAVATCNTGCPLGVDIPGFIRLLREGDSQGALAIILQQNPFPALCGRVCAAPCETACIFHAEGNPITIRELERYAADHGAVKNVKRTVLAKTGRKVAVIGSGPGGLTAAYQLALSGVEVTIFEATAHPGGALRFLIPEFRLPQQVVDDIITQVKHLGVQIQTNTLFGRTITLAEIFMRGFDAVVLSVGSSMPKFQNIVGSQLAGVYYHAEFLSRLQQATKLDVMHQANMLIKGISTVIIGNDETIFDSARISRRLGQTVTVCWTGNEEKLAALSRIVSQAQEEGVMIKEGVALVRLVADEEGYVKTVVLKDLIENVDIELDSQTVILANGQQPNNFIRQHLPQLKFNDDGTIWVDKQTGMTSVEKVFACGSIVTGVSSMVESMSDAKHVAIDIKNYLERK